MDSQLMTDTVRSRSIGVPGRALNSARAQHFILDSSSGPSEALTNSEAFLAGISSCGVTLIEKYARETRVPMTSMEVMIAGTRSRSDPAHFQSIEMRFDIHGVGKREADHLVGIWQSR
jgi:uncharacterized OsmC-like protein